MLRCKKAPGFDGINNTMIKRLPLTAMQYLLDICNSIQYTKQLPSSFKEAIVIPIQKAGKDPHDINGYRPISLLTAFSKIFERLLLVRINTFNKANDIIPSYQYGFRSEHSATHQATKMTAHLVRNKRNKTTSGLITMDVAKAFDSVWHDALTCKLEHIGMPSNMIKTIDDYCRHRTYRVRIDDTLSDQFDIPNGLPQGAVLSPKLYTMFVADMPQINTATIYMFADDTAILATSKQKHAISTKLENAYSMVNRFYAKWHIAVNAEKTKLTFFPFDNKRKRTQGRNPLVDDIELTPSATSKYLGVLYDSKLSFVPHIESQKNKIIAISRQISPMVRGAHLNEHRRKLIVKQILWPVIFYAASAWSTAAVTHIKPLRQKFSALARNIMKLPKRHRTTDLYDLINMRLPDDLINDSRRNLIDKLAMKTDRNLNELSTFLSDTWPEL